MSDLESNVFVLYSREKCPLCEKAKQILEEIKFESGIVYTEIDMVTTPSGSPVAMAHANNCTSDLNAWVNIFKEYSEAMGMKVDMEGKYNSIRKC